MAVNNYIISKLNVLQSISSRYILVYLYQIFISPQYFHDRFLSYVQVKPLRPITHLRDPHRGDSLLQA